MYRDLEKYAKLTGDIALPEKKLNPTPLSEGIDSYFIGLNCLTNGLFEDNSYKSHTIDGVHGISDPDEDDVGFDRFLADMGHGDEDDEEPIVPSNLLKIEDYDPDEDEYDVNSVSDMVRTLGKYVDSKIIEKNKQETKKEEPKFNETPYDIAVDDAQLKPMVLDGAKKVISAMKSDGVESEYYNNPEAKGDLLYKMIEEYVKNTFNGKRESVQKEVLDVLIKDLKASGGDILSLYDVYESIEP